jgi:hypothetical protein
MRTVALDVHKRFAEVAVHEDGALFVWGALRPRSVGCSRSRWAPMIMWSWRPRR